ncbi:hypothetical protein G6F40_017817 [Rhizopus arrhizus]|nr:hypothetical protein G6F40_017817 [Rhizopus arrhizus]
MRLGVVPRRRARPDLPRRDACARSQRRQAVQPRALAHRHIALQHRVRPDVGLVGPRALRPFPAAPAPRPSLFVLWTLVAGL